MFLTRNRLSPQKEYKRPNGVPSILSSVDFQSLWQMPLEPLDAPNTRKKGWSRVFLWTIGDTRLIVKRQENYTCKTFLHPLAGIPTLRREFNNLQRFGKRKIPVPEPVYFSEQRTVCGKRQAILITEYLEGHDSLQNRFDQWTRDGATPAEKQKVIRAVASLVAVLHKNKFRHRHLVPKHILLSQTGCPPQARLIDLEAAIKFVPFQKNRLKDLVSLNRRLVNANRTDRLRFLFAYLQIQTWTAQAKRLARSVLRHTERKERRP